jgi:zinc transporter 9
MNDFFLKPSDLEILRKTRRRSPYESEPPITVKQFLKIYNW